MEQRRDERADGGLDRPLDPRECEETRGAGQGGPRAEEHEYQWHTGAKREHGGEDAVEFIDVVKAFGRNRVLNGLNLGLPDNQISMILGPRAPASRCASSTWSVSSIPMRATSSFMASRFQTWPTTSSSRCARSSASCSRTARCSAR